MHDLQRYLVEEFAEDYRDGEMSRRDLLRRVLLITGSVAVTATMLTSLGIHSAAVEAAIPRTPRPAAPALLPDQTPPSGTIGSRTLPPAAQTTDNVIDPNDPDIQVTSMTYGGAAGDVFAYLTQPVVAGPHAAVVVIHENRGLIEPAKDIARRYAKEGYVALAIDLVSRAGGTDQFIDDIAKATGFLGSSNPDDLVSDIMSGISWLVDQDFVSAERIAATGFCFGGGLVWRLAEAETRLKAAVPYYGPTPPLDQVPNITATIFAIYAELDTRITGSSVDLDAALDAAGKTHSKWIAPNSNHAFFNNTGTAYNPAGARGAWTRTLQFLQANL